MDLYRVRTINPDASVSVLDKTFSQVCEMLRPLDGASRESFWDKNETRLPSGHSVVFMREV